MDIVEHKHVSDVRDPDSESVGKLAVNYKDVLDLKYLYTLMHEWLVEEGYAPRDDSKFKEIFYYQKEDANAGNFYHWRWRLEKDPPETKLWKYELEIDTMVLSTKDVELAVKGKKVKAQKGEIEVSITGFLIPDPNGRFSRGILKKFRRFILKNFLRKHRDHYKSTLESEMKRFQEAIKSYLKLETYLPERETADFWRQAP
ncbi:hypothetical protein HYT23_04445 [Candidatus Pacearchaeota archaeon]|nr:hypothetical protein [Candidatus Pacearchaeota archaeon]